MLNSERLPHYIVPINYSITLEPDLKNFIFSGTEKIITKIMQPTNHIILNSKELKIKKAYLKHNAQTLVPNISLDEKKESVILSFKEKIPIAESAELFLEFEGTINEDLNGLYKSKYNYKNKTKYLATTQCEAPYARKIFPCFDEPDKKAEFNIAVLIDKKMQAISNMPIASEKIINNKKLVVFYATPKMPTYLFYLGIGNFEFLQSNYNKTKLRVITTPGKSQYGKFALDLTKKFLKYFEGFSQIPYPLPKLDLIAVPDFAMGAMENWGAITFRELDLLFNPKKTSVKVKRRIAEVIAHELWHQWSGNLVTMKWWNDLWLNESFATYMAYKALDNYFPEWNIWEDFVLGQTMGAFGLDSLKTTHPIEVKVNSANEIEDIFDEISYGKGGSILRMIDYHLSHEKFRKGVSNYLKKHEYSNAIASDLWNSLAKISGSDIKSLMESWVKQPGYPLLEIEKKGNKVIIKQKRFNHNSKQLWHVPVSVKTENIVKEFVISKAKSKIKLPESKFLHANAMQKGFYRVKYSLSVIKKLLHLIQNKKLSPLERWGIESDMFNLCMFENTPIQVYFELLKYYKNEDNYIVLLDIYVYMHKIYLLYSDMPWWNDVWPKFKEHIAEPFRNNLYALGWQPKKNEPINNTLVRSLSISFLSFVEDKETIKKGLEKCKNLYSLNPEISGELYVLAATHNKEMYKNIMKLYLNPPSLEEKVKALRALYRFQDKSLLHKSLDFALTNNVRSQELRRIFGALRANPFSKEIFFDWAKSRWNKLKKYKDSHHIFTDFLSVLITMQTKKEKLHEIRLFIDANQIQYKKTKANAFETAHVNAEFMKKNADAIRNYFLKP